MSNPSVYELYELKTNKYVMSGTRSEIADRIGVPSYSITNVLRSHSGIIKGYKVVVVMKPDEK